MSHPMGVDIMWRSQWLDAAIRAVAPLIVRLVLGTVIVLVALQGLLGVDACRAVLAGLELSELWCSPPPQVLLLDSPK